MFLILHPSTVKGRGTPWATCDPSPGPAPAPAIVKPLSCRYLSRQVESVNHSCFLILTLHTDTHGFMHTHTLESGYGVDLFIGPNFFFFSNPPHLSPSLASPIFSPPPSNPPVNIFTFNPHPLCIPPEVLPAPSRFFISNPSTAEAAAPQPSASPPISMRSSAQRHEPGW